VKVQILSLLKEVLRYLLAPNKYIHRTDNNREKRRSRSVRRGEEKKRRVQSVLLSVMMILNLSDQNQEE
jgi:hypothetical protein